MVGNLILSSRQEESDKATRYRLIYLSYAWRCWGFWLPINALPIFGTRSNPPKVGHHSRISSLRMTWYYLPKQIWRIVRASTTLLIHFVSYRVKKSTWQSRRSSSRLMLVRRTVTPFVIPSVSDQLPTCENILDFPSNIRDPSLGILILFWKECITNFRGGKQICSPWLVD